MRGEHPAVHQRLGDLSIRPQESVTAGEDNSICFLSFQNYRCPDEPVEEQTLSCLEKKSNYIDRSMIKEFSPVRSLQRCIFMAIERRFLYQIMMSPVSVLSWKVPLPFGSFELL